MMRPSKENCKNSPEKSRKTITHLLSLAVKREISWKILAPLINEMASSLEKSKEIIKIMLIEFEKLSTSTQHSRTENGSISIKVSQNNSVVCENEQASDCEDVLVDKSLDKSDNPPDDESLIEKEINGKLF